MSLFIFDKLKLLLGISFVRTFVEIPQNVKKQSEPAITLTGFQPIKLFKSKSYLPTFVYGV